MIKRTLHYLWGKKFIIIFLTLALILLPNTIGHGLQVQNTTVITEMVIERNGQDEVQITAKKFKPTAGADSVSYETITYQGTNVREMLKDVSLAHCTKLEFSGQPDLDILHDLYHYQDLRGNTKVNHNKTINELLKNYEPDAHKNED